MVSSSAQSTVGYSESLRHSPVMRNLVLTLVGVVVEYQLTFIARKYFKTLHYAVVCITGLNRHVDFFRNLVSHNFFAASGFVGDITRNRIEVSSWFSNVGNYHVRDLHRNSVNCDVSEIFSVVKTI